MCAKTCSALLGSAPLSGSEYSAVELLPDNRSLILLDQRKLPEAERYIRVDSVAHAASAIHDMVVRGAPAIGIAAAYAMTIATTTARENYLEQLRADAELLIGARPTAANLAWAIERCLSLAERHQGLSAERRTSEMADFARGIHREDVRNNRRMGKFGAEHIGRRVSVLTHCNAGALATGGYGTALGVVRALHEKGMLARVMADETRPFLQGARLTAWELRRDSIDVDVIVDASSAWFMRKGEVDCVIVGSDRVAKNGDAANKIGTYGLACLAREHGIPFYVAAPFSTVDENCPDGNAIVIEERSDGELRSFFGQRLIVDGAGVKNPAFDVTPSEWITALFTERGVVAPVTAERLAQAARRG